MDVAQIQSGCFDGCFGIANLLSAAWSLAASKYELIKTTISSAPDLFQTTCLGAQQIHG
jgi:hypothetical protein